VPGVPAHRRQPGGGAAGRDRLGAPGAGGGRHGDGDGARRCRVTGRGARGTTVAPWQLFFQQSNVVDKRITTRFPGYERADIALGTVLFAAGALGVLAVVLLPGSRVCRSRRED
jgi:hypothetical protein